jgi:YHS domain-containing protein
MRILLLILLVYVGYRVLKGLIGSGGARREREETETLPVDDVMIKDPLCETYFPKKDGVKAVVKGEALYFCSEACRDEYLDRMDGTS